VDRGRAGLAVIAATDLRIAAFPGYLVNITTNRPLIG
jgi:hypothetical protein